ncbi:hypothetical protein [Arenibaculum sp.]|uniref:hypothetical protein n=1 Tax=Arenibaculum sp. TaxID=2865862 RepID=UPI002E14C141|nr:hypothetical protein [Arenibaculum sp.]
MARKSYGIAREAQETRKLNQLADEYGSMEVAIAIMTPQLRQHGCSPENFKAYLNVKGLMQHGALDVDAAEKEAQRKVKTVLDSVFGKNKAKVD